MHIASGPGPAQRRLRSTLCVALHDSGRALAQGALLRLVGDDAALILVRVAVAGRNGEAGG